MHLADDDPDRVAAMAEKERVLGMIGIGRSQEACPVWCDGSHRPDDQPDEFEADPVGVIHSHTFGTYARGARVELEQLETASGRRQPVLIEVYTPGGIGTLEDVDEVIARRDALTETIAAFGVSERAPRSTTRQEISPVRLSTCTRSRRGHCPEHSDSHCRRGPSG
jgi:hypothetical protein